MSIASKINNGQDTGSVISACDNYAKRTAYYY